MDLFVFMHFNHHGTHIGSFPESFMKIQLYLAEIFRIYKRFIYLFVCLFIDLFVFFYFNHLGTPTASYPENFMKIGLDLAEILRISKLDWRGGGGKKGRNPTL